MIIIGSDHGGYELKEFLKKRLEKQNLPYIDCGCDGSSVDYPDIAEAVCKKVLKAANLNKGVLICGTGVGISIAANKFPGIRAALCTNYYAAKYTRKHNNSNVICFGGRVTGDELAWELLDVWLNTDFDGGRHATRLEKIAEIERQQQQE